MELELLHTESVAKHMEVDLLKEKDDRRPLTARTCVDVNSRTKIYSGKLISGLAGGPIV